MMKMSCGKAPIMGLLVLTPDVRICDGELDWQNRGQLGKINHRVRVIPVGRGQKSFVLLCRPRHRRRFFLCRRGMSQAALWPSRVCLIIDG